jgi:hypothetical protein
MKLRFILSLINITNYNLFKNCFNKAIRNILNIYISFTYIYVYIYND